MATRQASEESSFRAWFYGFIGVCLVILLPLEFYIVFNKFSNPMAVDKIPPTSELWKSLQLQIFFITHT